MGVEHRLQKEPFDALNLLKDLSFRQGQIWTSIECQTCAPKHSLGDFAPVHPCAVGMGMHVARSHRVTVVAHDARGTRNALGALGMTARYEAF
jgi:hypothetical protein